MRLTEEQRKIVEELRPLALHIAKQDGRVEDAASVALLALCRAVARYPADSPVPLKVYVACRVRRDVRNKRRKKRPKPIGLCETVEARPAGGSLELPPALQATLDLHYRDGYSQAETAARLGVSLRTVERRAHDIRESLRGGS